MANGIMRKFDHVLIILRHSILNIFTKEKVFYVAYIGCHQIDNNGILQVEFRTPTHSSFSVIALIFEPRIKLFRGLLGNYYFYFINFDVERYSKWKFI